MRALTELVGIDEGKGQEMAAHEIALLDVKADEKSTKFIDPGKSSFAGETVVIDDFIEKAFATAFGRLTVALVLSNVGNQLMIEADFASSQCVKAAVGVEDGSGIGQPQAFDSFEGRLQLLFEVEGVVMVARDNIR